MTGLIKRSALALAFGCCAWALTGCASTKEVVSPSQAVGPYSGPACRPAVGQGAAANALITESQCKKVLRSMRASQSEIGRASKIDKTFEKNARESGISLAGVRQTKRNADAWQRYLKEKEIEKLCKRVSGHTTVGHFLSTLPDPAHPTPLNRLRFPVDNP